MFALTNEVEALADVASQVRSDEVDRALFTTELAVEVSRPDLGIGGQFVGRLIRRRE